MKPSLITDTSSSFRTTVLLFSLEGSSTGDHGRQFATNCWQLYRRIPANTIIG